MNQRPAVMNVGNLTAWTERAKQRVQAWVDLANRATMDTLKTDRLERHECVACFYSSKIGGAAMTYRPCMSCGTDELYGSTATDVLCLQCAVAHRLCKHCGGDLEMKVRRNAWDQYRAPAPATQKGGADA